MSLISASQMWIFSGFFNPLTANWISLGCGQKKTFEDVTFGLGKQRSTFFTIFWHFMDQTTNRENDQDRLMDNNCWLQPYYINVSKVIITGGDKVESLCQKLIPPVVKCIQYCQHLICIAVFSKVTSKHNCRALTSSYIHKKKRTDDLCNQGNKLTELLSTLLVTCFSLPAPLSISYVAVCCQVMCMQV